VAMYRICAVCIACGGLHTMETTISLPRGTDQQTEHQRRIAIRPSTPNSRAEVRASALPKDRATLRAERR
jgi:hypothetical protein